MEAWKLNVQIYDKSGELNEQVWEEKVACQASASIYKGLLLSEEDKIDRRSFAVRAVAEVQVFGLP